MEDSISSILILVLLITMSAYFSATETAYSSLNKIKLKSIANKGNKKAKLALELSEKYDSVISTILIPIKIVNIVNIATASLATVLFTKLLGSSGVTVSTIVMTILILIFGEISPKSIAKDIPESFAIFSAPLLNAFCIILKPVNNLFCLNADAFVL